MRRHSALPGAVALTLLAVVAPTASRASAPPTPTPRLPYDAALAAVRTPGFAGIWVEGDTLVVYLTRPDATAARAARAEVADLLDRADFADRTVVARAARYSFRELAAWRDALRASVFALPGARTADVDERANVVRFGVSDVAALAPRVAALAAARGIPADAVAVSPAAAARPTTLRQGVRPLVGGIYISNGYGECTLGFPATVTLPGAGPVKGFVTASHCTAVQGAVDGTTFLQPFPRLFPPPDANGHLAPVGVEMLDPAPTGGGHCTTAFCRNSDAAFVRLLDAAHYRGGAIAKPSFGTTAWDGSSVFRVTSDGDPTGGDTISAVGITSGWTSGSVVSTCVDHNAGDLVPRPTNGSDVVDTYVLACQAEATYTSRHGDSGGPVFVATGTDVRLVGINWGSAGGAPDRGIFSTVGGIEADLGVALETCDAAFAC